MTGASGFLGSFVIPWLEARGHRVCAVSRRADVNVGQGSRAWTVPASAATEDWRAALAGCGVVLHLAGRAHVIEETSADTLAAYHAANVEMTRRVLAAAAAAGCRTFVFASSVKAMGEWTTAPWTEDTPAVPVDSYGVSKLEAEAVVAEGGRRLGLRTVSLRLPALYGPGMRANLLRLFRAVARRTPLPLGSVDNRRSFLFAGNAAAALEAVMRHAGPLRAHYLVSDGDDLSTPGLIRAMAEALGRRPHLIPVPPGLFRLAGRIGDRLPSWFPWPITSARVARLMGSLQVDSSRFRNDLGFIPPYSVAEGMRETARWFVAHPAAVE